MSEQKNEALKSLLAEAEEIDANLGEIDAELLGMQNDRSEAIVKSRRFKESIKAMERYLGREEGMTIHQMGDHGPYKYLCEGVKPLQEQIEEIDRQVYDLTKQYSKDKKRRTEMDVGITALREFIKANPMIDGNHACNNRFEADRVKGYIAQWDMDRRVVVDNKLYNDDEYMRLRALVRKYVHKEVFGIDEDDTELKIDSVWG